MCSSKTMLKIGGGLALVGIAAYLVVPIDQGLIQKMVPLVAVLACPLAMYLGMRTMGEQDKQMKTPLAEKSIGHDRA